MTNSHFTQTTVSMKIKSFSLVVFLLLGWSLVPVHWVHHLGEPRGNYSFIIDTFGNLVSISHSSDHHSSTEAPHPHSQPADTDESHALCLSNNTKCYPASQTVYDFQPYFTLQEADSLFVIFYRSKIYLKSSPSRAPPLDKTLS